jgi:mono/diheme cytochrome c family protein
MLKLSFGALVAIGLTSLIPRNAEAISLGQFEYRNSCVQCHGVSGKGDGPLAEFLKTPPSDLTVLQKNSGGIFPVTRVYATIEGTDDVRIHGPRDMPVWGDRFRARTQNDEEAGFATDKDVRQYARTRILALIEYLSTIQAK